jgi:hypothetical protein
VVAPEQNRVSRIAAIGLLVSGCLYVDPINQRPSIDISPRSSDVVYRGSHILLDAIANDPEGQNVAFTWHASACIDATDLATCDAPFHSELGPTAGIDVPIFLDDGLTPVQSLRVVLEAKDDLGATAKPPQILIVPVADQPPDLALRKTSRYSYVVGTPIALYAQVGDADDGAGRVAALDWTVFSPPAQPAFSLVDLAVPPNPDDPDHVTTGKTFTPMGVGDWDIQVTATDPLGTQTVEHLIVPVVADHPPCLEQWAPIAPTGGASLPLYDPTLFQVQIVVDDLDVYPPIPGDAVLGTTGFAWSLLPPGAGSRVPLTGISGNSVGIDPATYPPGSTIELRVEIDDRNHTPITCTDASPTCSVISDPACIQRLTWKVEVR